MTSRRDEFDDFVLDAAARLEATCGRAFPAVEFAVEDVPRGPGPVGPPRGAARPALPGDGRRARLASSSTARPVETRVTDRRDVAALVADIVTEQVAGLLGVSPEELDPGFGE